MIIITSMSLTFNKLSGHEEVFYSVFCVWVGQFPGLSKGFRFVSGAIWKGMNMDVRRTFNDL